MFSKICCGHSKRAIIIATWVFGVTALYFLLEGNYVKFNHRRFDIENLIKPLILKRLSF